MSSQTSPAVPTLSAASLRRVLVDLAPLAVLDGDLHAIPLLRVPGGGGASDGLSRTEAASASGQLDQARALTPRLAIVREAHGVDAVVVLLWLAKYAGAFADPEAFALLFGRHHGPVEMREAFAAAEARAASTAEALDDAAKRLAEARGAKRGLTALTPEWALAVKYVTDCERRHAAATGRAASAAQAFAVARAKLLDGASARLAVAVEAWLGAEVKRAA